MLRIIFLLFIALIFSVSSKSQQKLSVRQEKLEIYLKKYRSAIEKAPDSISKFRVYSAMWGKHMRFIQDTLKFSTYPTYTLDTFYFEKVYVTRTNKNKKKYMHVILENNFYAAINSFDVTKNQNLLDIPIYRMLIKLNKNAPVLAVINLQDLFLGDTNLDKGTKKIYLSLSLDSIYNIK